jgi:2-methylcitrate dehydratase PrpD
MSAAPAPLTERLVAVALDAYRPETARVAGGRALFDHLACRAAGRRVVPPGVGDAGAAAATDRDDVHWPSLTHPGAIVWTAVLTADPDDETRWRAALAGYEVTARLGRALGAEHRRYWHATATAGAVGGAVAAAVARGSDPVAAAGHAISIAGGSIVCALERSGTRIAHRDLAAATAIRCAQLSGLPATRAGLEHPRGLFAAMGGSPDRLLEPAERPAIAELAFRLHATCGFAQALVEAARELAGDTLPGHVAVRALEATLALADDPAPDTVEDAWWSCQHAVAATLLGVDLEDLDHPDVAALRARVELRPGPRSRVSVDGRSAEREAAAPATDADLVAKWRTLNPEDEPPLHLLATIGGAA